MPDKQKKSSARKRKTPRAMRLVFMLSAASTAIYLVWRVLFTLPFGESPVAFAFGTLLLLSEIIAALGTWELYYHKLKASYIDLTLPVIPESWYPDVDVLIATHNEEPELLYKTVNACVHFDYPDKRKVHIYLSDDANRLEVRRLAEHFNVGYLGAYNNKEAKSGNFNNALSHTHSPLIATFDADMIGQHTFLTETVPYFFLPFVRHREDGGWDILPDNEVDPNYRIGLIQTPQSFYNPDLFQFNLYAEGRIPNEQDYFSREINQMRNSGNSIAYTGSNTLILRRALEEIGGFPTDTITEDFETGLRIQTRGYTCYATDKVQAAGLSTTTIKSMITQRVRWGRGVVQSVKNCHVLTNRAMSWEAKFSYLACFSYWWSFLRRLTFMFAPILFAVFDLSVVRCNITQLIVLWLPSAIMENVAQRYLNSHLRTQRWNQIIDTIFAPFLCIPVLMETIGFKQLKFKVTDKKKTKSSRAGLYVLPHLTMLLLSVLGLVRFTYGKSGEQLLYGSLIIFWLVYNMIDLVYALMFMNSRPIVRSSERFRAHLPVELNLFDTAIESETRDISEGGFSFLLNQPLNLPVRKNLSIRLWWNGDWIPMTVHVLYVDYRNSQWLYHCVIDNMSEPAWREYLQAIYDREHSLPQKLDRWYSTFDNLLIIQTERLKKHQPIRSSEPQIEINQILLFQEGGSCFAERICFAYDVVYHPDEKVSMALREAKEYCLWVRELHMPSKDIVTLRVSQDYVLKLRPEMSDQRHMTLRIVNYADMMGQPLFMQAVCQWVNRIGKEHAQ